MATKKPSNAMKVKSSGKPFEIGEKRFYMPGTIISGKCPKCGASYKRDLEVHYLSYPEANTPIDFTCYCGKCEHEWAVRVVLRVSLEMAAEPTQSITPKELRP